MFCALLTSRYQVSGYRTNGPLVVFSIKTCTNEARREKAHLKCVTDQGPLKQASVATET